MTKKRSIYYGVHAVLYALFREDESLDLDAMAAEAEFCISKGCHGITILGLATEANKLTDKERRSVIEVVSGAVKGRVPFSVTIVGNSVGEQVSLAKFAASLGADLLILQPPNAGTYSAQTYLDFYSRVASKVNLPIALQNAPQLLGRALQIADIHALKNQCPNLEAVKFEDTSINLNTAIETLGDEIQILGGRGGLEMTDCLRAGCRGFVLAPDIAPVASQIFELWVAGQHDNAELKFQSAAAAISFVMQSLENLICYGKRIYGHSNGVEIFDRQPSIALNAFGETIAKHWAQHLEGLWHER